MSDPVLDYSPPPRRPSPGWGLLRGVVALVFGAWGLWLIYMGVGELVGGTPAHFAGQGFLGLVFCAVAVAALRLPVRWR